MRKALFNQRQPRLRVERRPTERARPNELDPLVAEEPESESGTFVEPWPSSSSPTTSGGRRAASIGPTSAADRRNAKTIYFFCRVKITARSSPAEQSSMDDFAGETWCGICLETACGQSFCVGCLGEWRSRYGVEEEMRRRCQDRRGW